MKKVAFQQRFAWLALGLLLSAYTVTVYAAMPVTAMPWGDMAMQLFGGLALFLFGMEMMADALKAVAGERMKVVLARLTSNRITGALTGALVTAVIQSSSVTTVLVVGFITANLMSLSQSVGVIMGANIGTTITAQIVAFKVTKYAMLMITSGFAMQFFSKRENVVRYGEILMGLGLIFFGMSVMGDGMKPLRDYEPFLALMSEMQNPLLGIAIAAVFTALVQSSSATTGIVIVMASQGLITLEAGIALIFGANIGTCVTAALASIGKPREAVRAAVVHILFNIMGVVLWLGFIGYLSQLVTWLSPTAEGLVDSAKLSAEVPRQIANAHTIFNIANTLIFLGFTTQFARLVQWLVPDKPEEKGVVEIKPRHLDDLLLDTPALALDAVRHELARMGRRVDDMLYEITPAMIDGDARRLQMIADMDNEVDALHGFIIKYLGEISKTQLTNAQTHELIRIMEAVNDLENVGDVIETNMVALGVQRIEEDITISPNTRDVLNAIYESVAKMLHDSVEAVTSQNLELAQQVMERKDDINEMVSQAYLHQAQRLVVEEPGRLPAYRMETDAIEKYKRIYYYARRMAKTVMETAETKKKMPVAEAVVAE